MDDISFRMPEKIYSEDWGKVNKEQCYLLALFADAFKTIEFFCQGMKIGAIPQCGMVLRLSLEQTAIIKVLSGEGELLSRFIKHYAFRKRINQLSRTKQASAIREEFGLNDKGVNPLQFLDYGWLGEKAMKANSKENYLIERAGLKDFIAWKKQFLDKFAHQSFTFVDIADASTDEGTRLTKHFLDMSCKLFDELCCAYHDLTGFDFVWDGQSKFQSIFRPIYQAFKKQMDEHKAN